MPNPTPNPKRLDILQTWKQMVDRHENASERVKEHVGEFLRLLEKHILKRHDVKFYAKKLHISPDYLLQSCRKVLELTPTECIHTLLMWEAEKLVTARKGMTISQIATDLGFGSSSHFCYLFRTHHDGLPPGAYRKMAVRRRNSKL